VSRRYCVHEAYVGHVGTVERAI